MVIALYFTQSRWNIIHAPVWWYRILYFSDLRYDQTVCHAAGLEWTWGGTRGRHQHGSNLLCRVSDDPATPEDASIDWDEKYSKGAGTIVALYLL